MAWDKDMEELNEYLEQTEELIERGNNSDNQYFDEDEFRESMAILITKCI